MSPAMRGRALCKHAIITAATLMPIYHLIIVRLLSWRQLCRGAAPAASPNHSSPSSNPPSGRVAASAWMAAFAQQLCVCHLSKHQKACALLHQAPAVELHSSDVRARPGAAPLETNWVGSRAAHGLQEPPCLGPLQTRSCFASCGRGAQGWGTSACLFRPGQRIARKKNPAAIRNDWGLAVRADVAAHGATHAGLRQSTGPPRPGPTGNPAKTHATFVPRTSVAHGEQAAYGRPASHPAASAPAWHPQRVASPGRCRLVQASADGTAYPGAPGWPTAPGRRPSNVTVRCAHAGRTCLASC